MKQKKRILFFTPYGTRTGSEMLIGGYDQDPAANLMDFHETIFNSSIPVMSMSDAEESFP